MKPDTHQKNYRSTVGAGVKMSIDESATAHIMDVLTKLYSDPLLAIEREYATNALDSNIEAGNGLPIEVTLPTTMEPTLTISDQGIGLNAEDIAEIYSRYGTSTKRETNEAVGMLGLGCKSALSYTDQFTLIGRKDGVTTTVLISRDEDGAGSMTVVDETADFQPDGVTVSIPIKLNDVDDARTKAMRFFKFWEPGTVLVDGEEPPRIDGMWLDERTLLTKDEDVTESLVVMGNVPYPLTDGAPSLYEQPGYGRRVLHGGRWVYEKWQAVVFVPIGSVNFAPSRESLMDTKRTRATLDSARLHIKQTLEASIRKNIAEAKDAKDAQERLLDGKSLGINLTDATWNGRVVMLSLKREQPAGTYPSSGPEDWETEKALKHSYLFLNPRARKAGERSSTVSLANVQDHHIIVGFDGKNWTNVKRAKLELFMQQKGIDRIPPLLAVDKLTPDEKFWLKGWTTWKWEHIAATELPKVVNSDGSTVRLKGSYDVNLDGSMERGTPANKVAEWAKTRGLYWTHGNVWSAAHHSAIKQGVIPAQGSVVVALGANRVEKFKRDFPQAKELNAAAREAAERWVKNQDAEKVRAYSIQRESNIELLKGLDATRLDDPDLREVHRLATKDVSDHIAAVAKYSRWIGPAHDGAPSLYDKAKQAAWADKVLAKYPLYHSIGRYNVNSPKAKDHLILYLNTVYSTEKGA